jgi:hypothetical protein
MKRDRSGFEVAAVLALIIGSLVLAVDGESRARVQRVAGALALIIVSAFLGIEGEVIVQAQGGTDPAVVNGEPTRFESRTVRVDAGDTPLAAYQFELRDPEGRIEIVGLEGGESAAFRDPPYYDADSLTRGRLVVAAFSTGEDLPTGATRVARLHLRIRGDGDPELDVQLVVAGDREGREIPAKITIDEREAK